MSGNGPGLHPGTGDSSTSRMRNRGKLHPGPGRHREVPAGNGDLHGRAGRGQERLSHLANQDAVEGIRRARIPRTRTASDLGAATTREVNENARAGTNVGAPVAATDIGNRGVPENLTYELSGTDTGNTSRFRFKFDIDQRTGQIKVKRGTNLDYEELRTDSDPIRGVRSHGYGHRPV